MKTGRRFVRNADGTYEETYDAWVWWIIGLGIALYIIVEVAIAAG